jgi:hypothetical protein
VSVATRNLIADEVQDAAPPRQSSDPDVELRIWLVNDSSATAGKSLRFELTAPEFGHQEEPFGPHLLAGDPQSYFERFFGRISGPDGSRPAQLAALCAELTEVLPRELHDRLWELRDQGLTLWIRPEAEAWIPWEVLELRVKEGGRWRRGPLLCEAFRITRWPAGVPCQRDLPVRHLAAVLGKFADLHALPEEQSFLEGLREDGRTVDVLPPVRDDVLAAMENGHFDAWHFASHGEWQDSDPTGAEIRLSLEESIKLRDVAHGARNFCSNHPLVVLNACHLGRGGRGLVSWSGWTARLVQMEAGAILGALWPVEDQASVRFVRTFYEAFLAGTPLAEAVQRARIQTREEFPEASTWLAFVAYGHPLAVCAAPNSSLKLPPPEPQERDEATSSPAVQVVDERRGKRGRSATKHASPLARRLRWAVAGLALSLLVFAVLAGVRTDTRIKLDLTVNRLAFTAGGEKAAPLTDSPLPLESATIARFARLEMHPQDLSRFDAQKGWNPVTELAERVAFVAQGPGSQASFEASGSAHRPAILTLDRWWIEPGSRVIVRAAKAAQLDQGKGIEIGLEVASSGSLALSIHEPFTLTADFVAFSGLGQESGDLTIPQAFLTGRLRNDRPSVDVFPGSESLSVSGIVGPSVAAVPLLSRELPITSLDLLTQDVDEEWLSTLVGEGTLSYPDREQAITLAAGEFLVVEGLRDLWLRRIDLNPESGSLRISLDGIAQEIRSGPKDQGRDHRLSLYDTWIHGPLVQSLAAWITGWIALALTLAEIRQHLAKRD